MQVEEERERERGGGEGEGEGETVASDATFELLPFAISPLRSRDDISSGANAGRLPIASSVLRPL